MRSGQFTMGAEVAAFEREFADWHGIKHGIMVNSGSSANLVAIASLSAIGYIRPGDSVMVPALAWPTTYAPLIQYGLNLVLIDCDGTWNLDPESRNIADEAKLIVGASILGNPMDTSAWSSIAGVIRAVLMEDNCESLGAVTPGGRLTGTQGLVNTFSFFWSHQISAIEGGMVLTDDDDVANHCRMMRNHGWSRDVDPPQTFEGEYDFRVFGYNVRPLELHAAVAREQLKKLPEFMEHRRRNAALFREATMDLAESRQIIHPDVYAPDLASPFSLHFLIPHGGKQARASVVTALRAAGIDCRQPTGGSFRKHAYGEPWAKQSTPLADMIHQTGLFIGNPPWPAAEWIEKAAGIIRRVLA